jgi:hypothetical protein
MLFAEAACSGVEGRILTCTRRQPLCIEDVEQDDVIAAIIRNNHSRFSSAGSLGSNSSLRIGTEPVSVVNGTLLSTFCEEPSMTAFEERRALARFGGASRFAQLQAKVRGSCRDHLGLELHRVHQASRRECGCQDTCDRAATKAEKQHTRGI